MSFGHRESLRVFDLLSGHSNTDQVRTSENTTIEVAGFVWTKNTNRINTNRIQSTYSKN